MALKFGWLTRALIGSLALLTLLLPGCGTSNPAKTVRDLKPAAKPEAATTYARGHVLDQTSGRGVAGALVRMAYGPARTVSSADGSFTLGPIPLAGGRLVVVASGYALRTVELQSGWHEGVRVELARGNQGLGYRLQLTLQSGRLEGTGRVAMLANDLLVTGREGRSGTLVQLDPVTGQQGGRFSGAMRSWGLPAELADIAAHPSAGVFVLANSGRVYHFDKQAKYRTSAEVANGLGAIATDGERVYVSSGDKVRLLSNSLEPLAEWLLEAGETSGLALDSLGNLFVSTWEGRILEFDADGRQLADFGVPDLGRCGGIAVADNGDLFLTDVGGHRVVVVNAIGQSLGSFGETDLRSPRGLTIDSQGAVLVGDVALKAVLRFVHSPGTSGSKGSSLP